MNTTGWEKERRSKRIYGGRKSATTGDVQDNPKYQGTKIYYITAESKSKRLPIKTNRKRCLYLVNYKFYLYATADFFSRAN